VKTYYIPVHYFERDEDDNDVVMFVSQREYRACEFDDLLMDEARRHKESSYDCKEDMADAIFDALAKRIGGIWTYLEPQNTLTIGGFFEPDDKQMKTVDAAELAALLIKLQPGENLTFYMEYDKISDNTGEAYGVTLVNELDSHVLLINYIGGGSPCVIDITTYDSDLRRITDDIAEYFKWIDNAPSHVFIKESVIADIEGRE
jgi:hypothetical protein